MPKTLRLAKDIDFQIQYTKANRDTTQRNPYMKTHHSHTFENL